jgi:hypothetical protein
MIREFVNLCCRIYFVSDAFNVMPYVVFNALISPAGTSGGIHCAPRNPWANITESYKKYNQ